MSVGPVERDAATAEFFDAAAAGVFLLRRCAGGHYSEPPAARCTTCGDADLHWAPAAGGASLVSWAVTWTAAEPGAEAGATVLVIAELDEGPWWWSRLAGSDTVALSTGALSVGARLVLSFARADGEHEAVPVFRLAGQPA
ncbi:MAG TPA: hypothetical protein VEL03_18820 [Streptosporangiaceae bacterium]|nr:hypothetical protein [Streptosporangiaceae bacterium]